MTNIETWTREQCVEYLDKYPHSLNSDAVRKRLSLLTPQQQPNKSKNTAQTYSFSAIDSVAQAKEDPQFNFVNQADKPETNPQSTIARLQDQSDSDIYINEGEKGMAVIGKVFLTVLVFALCIVVVVLFQNIIGSNSYIITGPVCAAIGIPLINKIWK